MKNHFLILFVTILVFYITFNGVNAAPGIDYKFALLMSDGPQDLGFNFQLNEAKVAVEKALHITQFYTFVKVPVEESKDFLRDLCKQDYKGIIISSLEYNTIAQQVADEYPAVQFLLRGSTTPSVNKQYVTYNFPQTSYITGYVAALITNTNKLGYVQPGPPASNNYPGSAFFIGALSAARTKGVEITVESYTTGAWINLELSVGATNKLLDTGIDIIGQTQNDLSVSLTAIERGYPGMGTNGFPLSKIFGSKIAFSYVLNWTDCFYEFCEKIITYPNGVGYIPVNYYGDFANNFISYQPSHKIEPVTLHAIYSRIEALRTEPRALSEIYCDGIIRTLYSPTFATALAPNCISQGMFQNLTDPFPGYTYYGNYSVPITLRDVPKEITYGFNVSSGFCIFLCLILEVIIYINRDRAVIRSASPVFCYLIIFGGMIVYSGIIVWTSSPSIATCHARYWLVTIGYTTLIGSLVVKNFRIWLIFDNPELKTIKITNYQLFPWVGGLVLFNSLLLALISGIGNVELLKVRGVDDLGDYEYLEKCVINTKGDIALYILLGYFALLLLVGVFVSWKIRIVDIAEFNESKPIANTLYATSFSLFVIVSLVVSPQSNFDQTIILGVAGVFITTAALAILFIPKLFSLLSKPSNAADQLFSKKKSTVASSRSKSKDSSKNSGSVSHQTGMQANILAEFTDEDDISEKTDTETNQNEEVDPMKNSVHVNIPPPPKPTGPVLAVFTDDSISEGDDDDQNVFDSSNNV